MIVVLVLLAVSGVESGVVMVFLVESDKKMEGTDLVSVIGVGKRSSGGWSILSRKGVSGEEEREGKWRKSDII